jgi:CO/xanthine dehydrogenase Mo-binding subunit
VANAIYNATGARVTELPMTPDVILKALREARESLG